MSQVIMLFLFPIGIYFYFFHERPYRVKYEKVFTDFESRIQGKNSLTDAEKIDHYKAMLFKNEYHIKDISSKHVVGEKKVFSASLFAMSVGLYMIGAVFYLLYFYYLQKPHRVVFGTERIVI